MALDITITVEGKPAEKDAFFAEYAASIYRKPEGSDLSDEDWFHQQEETRFATIVERAADRQVEALVASARETAKADKDIVTITRKHAADPKTDPKTDPVAAAVASPIASQQKASAQP